MAGRVENQYTEIFRQLEFKNGTDIFAEYILPDTTEKRKEEIEENIFTIMREVNKVPMNVWDDRVIQESLRQLSDIPSVTLYNDGNYGFNPVGVNVLNYFFPELLDVRKPSCPLSIRDSFYDDKKLKRAIKKTLRYGGNELDIFKWLRIGGAGYCVNFRPATAKAIYEIFGKREDCKVFDSSSGYGARMLGAHFASNVREYVGIDPNTANHCGDEIEYLDKWFDTNTKKHVYEMGSEDFTSEAFPQYQDYFDIAFTSPPYFNTEMYSDAPTQSWKKFPTYVGWVDGFYKNTIYNTIDALKVEGIFSINIFEKVPNIRELTKLYAANKGFFLYKNDKYLLRTMPGGCKDSEGNIVSRERVTGDNFEPIWMFRHYSVLLRDGLITEEKAFEYKARASMDKKAPVL